MSRRLCVTLALPLAGLLLCTSAAAFVKKELVVSGLDHPVYLTAPQADDRLFILEQSGAIRLYKDGALQAQPFLDISSLVTFSGERGLLGLAFDPDFVTNRYFYVHYSDSLGRTTIARYQVSAGDPDVADAGSSQLVLSYAQPYSNHNGGTIDFGPDGYLYFGFGDGGSGGDPGNRAQDPSTLLGKIIRIDVSSLPYTIPPTNPYAGSGTVLNEIWARGVRNPYRWSFDRSTGDLWIGDVGQGSWEEIDFRPAGDPGGENYGWRLMEGTHCYNPPTNCGADTLDLPIYEYDHSNGDCSIIGGYVYRGTAIPALDGYYVFGDYCSSRVWALRYDGEAVGDVVELTDLLNSSADISGLSAIGQDGHGELYLIDIDGSTAGKIYRIVPDPTGVESDPDLGSIMLGPPTPNPFSASSRLRLLTMSDGLVSVRIFDASGRLVRTLMSETLVPGARYISWDGRDDSGELQSSGIYFVRAEANGRTSTRKLDLVR